MIARLIDSDSGNELARIELAQAPAVGQALQVGSAAFRVVDEPRELVSGGSLMAVGVDRPRCGKLADCAELLIEVKAIVPRRARHRERM